MKNTKMIEAAEKVTGEVVAYTPEEEKSYHDLCNAIKAEAIQKNNCELNICRFLYTIHKKQLYRIKGYQNIYETAYKEFGIGRTSCHNALSVYEHYGEINPDTGECLGLRPEYADFSFSQLIEMSHFPKELLETVTPEMSVRRLHKMRKAYISGKKPNRIRKEKQAHKARRKQLLNTEDIRGTLDKEKENLFRKIDDFAQEHPDTKYRIAITLLYEE